MSKFDYLVDSDAFIGRFFPNDAHYHECTKKFAQLESGAAQLVTTNLVILEVATVLSHKDSQEAARKFLQVIKQSQLPVIHLDEKLFAKSLELFAIQTKKGTSVVDCANVVVMERYKIGKIFSFDEVYPKSFNLQLA